MAIKQFLINNKEACVGGNVQTQGLREAQTVLLCGLRFHSDSSLECNNLDKFIACIVFS
jgi:hypothetical protein